MKCRMNVLLNQDRMRRTNGKIPMFQMCLRKCQGTKGIVSLFWRGFYKLLAGISHIEISSRCEIEGGLFIGHPYCITINADTKIGKNCNLHKCVTIGQENRGTRKGAPTIGNSVWIGIGTVIVGKITIGDDVLIAPNSYVNCDIPSHSVVLGNPCVIKHKKDATKDYINNKID